MKGLFFFIQKGKKVQSKKGNLGAVNFYVKLSISLSPSRPHN